MADNYLEKKFEEYAAKKAGKPVPRRVAPTSNRPGVVNVKFPRRRISRDLHPSRTNTKYSER